MGWDGSGMVWCLLVVLARLVLPTIIGSSSRTTTDPFHQRPTALSILQHQLALNPLPGDSRLSCPSLSHAPLGTLSVATVRHTVLAAPCCPSLSSMSSSLGASADDAATDDILSAGDSRAGRTEWEDALIKHNIIQADTQQLTEDERQLAGIEERAGRNVLADAGLDELDELEDDVDDRVLQQYRSDRHRCFLLVPTAIIQSLSAQLPFDGICC